jgi:hypothetical protein
MVRLSRRSTTTGLIVTGAMIAAFGGWVVIGEHQRQSPPSQTDDHAPGDDWNVFSATSGRWNIQGRLVERNGASFRIEIRVADDDGEAIPADARLSALLERPDHPAPAVDVHVRPTATGTYMIEGTAPAPGRWRMSIVFPDSVIHVRLSLGS